MVPIPFLYLGHGHAEFLANLYFLHIVPDRVPLEVLEQGCNLLFVLLLLVTEPSLQVREVLLLDPEARHLKVQHGLCGNGVLFDLSDLEVLCCRLCGPALANGCVQTLLLEGVRVDTCHSENLLLFACAAGLRLVLLDWSLLNDRSIPFISPPWQLLLA